MAHVKTASAARMNRDSKPKNLGIKLYGGARAKVGSILVRQKGTKVSAGLGTRLGNDYTVYAVQEGMVKFSQKLGKKYVNIINS